MHRHYIETKRLQEAQVTLARDEARHLQTVLRVRAGETVMLFDGAGRTVEARVEIADRTGMALAPLAPPTCHPPPACRLALFACVCKGARMDWTVEKAVELGVSCVVPVLSARTVVRLDEAEAAERQARWTRVAVEAARQSGTVWLPRIVAPLAFEAACARLREWMPVFVAALTSEARPMRQVLAEMRTRPPPATAGWFVGPEGDVTPGEMRQVVATGAIPVSLGHQVLRAETASLWGLCVLGAEWL